MRGHLWGLLYLNLVTVLWGTTFVVVKGTVEVLSPSLIILGRFLVASLCFLPFTLTLRKEDEQSQRVLWLAAFELGFWLWAGYATQAVGLQYTSASRSAFITALNVILVPIILGLFGRRIGLAVWAAAALAVVGVGLLSYDGSPPNLGDLWTLGCAFTYAAYIIRLESYAKRLPALGLTTVQVYGTALFALAWVLWEQPRVEWDRFPWFAIFYLGVFATALTTLLQTLGQGRVSAPEAAIIYVLEPVWASVFAFLLLGERLGVQGLVGAALVVSATLIDSLQYYWRSRTSARGR
ncbi:MAG: DMT family transporter [Deinococcota bacterium]|uniref:DMT family transporter n=1 Tax=Allomeiothermus silvanus TaxID=52022 RepID=UPI0023F11555|nr:DMT family transporter [Allomeiothermus silvanus]